jgi:hypothetical protein
MAENSNLSNEMKKVKEKLIGYKEKNKSLQY